MIYHTHVLGLLKRTVEIRLKLPAVLSLVQLADPECLRFRSAPEVPVTSVRVVVEKSRITTILVLFVLFGYCAEVPVRVDIRREDLEK